jgi:hypothetical protein
MLSDGQADSIGFGELLEPDGSGGLTQVDSFESDYFDGGANETLAEIPGDDSSLGTAGGTTANAETTLVARDIDGRPYLEGTSFEQGETFSDGDDKTDSPDNQPINQTGSDPEDISGNDGITIRTVAIEGGTSQTLAEATMTSYATGQRTYTLIDNDPVDIGEDIAQDINVTNGGETTIEQNITLRELADKLDPDKNGPLMLDGDLSTDGNDCFTPGAVHCFGFAWWLPEDVDNRIQSDSVNFDLGFVTEQCRNNDNPGQTFGFGNN